MKLTKREIFSRSHICGASISYHIIFIHRRASVGWRLISSPHMQSVSETRNEPQLRWDLAVFCSSGRAGGLSAADFDALFISVPCQRVLPGHTTPPSSQYVNKCVWHAMMRRTEWYRDPGRGTSGPVVETLGVGVRRHQLPPRSKRKCTYITAWAQKDSYSGRRS